MMNIEKADKKQIEEMAQIINGSTELDTIAYYRCINIAKTLYNAGYRKFHEDSVVLSREEWKQIKNSLYYSKEELEKKLQRERKETAEKILNEVLQEIFYYFDVQSVKELNEKSLLASTMTFDVVTDKIFEIATREAVEIKE